MVVFVVKRYAVREAEKWRYAVRKAKIGRYAVRHGGGGVTLLGAYLDESLKFSTDVKTKCRTVMLNYLSKKNIRKYLIHDATKKISIVVSNLTLDYGISESEL